MGKVIAIIVAALLIVGGGFAYVSSQNSGAVVAKATSTPVSTSAAPTATPTATPTAAPTTPAPTPTPVPTPTLEPGKSYLTLKVVDSKTGATVPGLFVFVYRYVADPCLNGQTQPAGAVRIGADGTGKVAVPDGNYFASISVPQGMSYAPTCLGDRFTVSGETLITVKATPK